MTQRILLIGAGAVGQVYGYHFQKSGAQVAFVVRPAYANAAREGFDMYPMNRRNPRSAPVRFEGFDVYTDLATALDASWDAVVICVSSTALRKGDWVDVLAAKVGDTTVVNLTPGLKDLAYLGERLPTAQIVSGLIGFSSYPGPLPGEELPRPGMVYWVPPLTKMTFSGSAERTEPVVAALTAGGLSSKRVDDVLVATAFGAPVLQFHIVALELVGWTFAGLRADKPLMALVHRAIGEATALAAQELDAKTPFALRMLKPWVVRTVTRLTPLIAPIDMERFFELHFLKVGDQTVFGLQTRIAMCEQAGLPADAMRELAERLIAHRAASDSDAPALAAAS